MKGRKVFSRPNSKLNEIPVDFSGYVRYKFVFILNDNHDLTVIGMTIPFVSKRFKALLWNALHQLSDKPLKPTFS